MFCLALCKHVGGQASHSPCPNALSQLFSTLWRGCALIAMLALAISTRLVLILLKNSIHANIRTTNTVRERAALAWRCVAWLKCVGLLQRLCWLVGGGRGCFDLAMASEVTSINFGQLTGGILPSLAQFFYHYVLCGHGGVGGSVYTM